MINNAALLWAFLALIIRLVIGLAIHIYSLSAGFQGFVPLSNFGDDIYYWDVAKQLLIGVVPDDLPNFYPWAVAAIIAVCGDNLFAGKFLNILLNSITVYFACLITIEVSKGLELSKKAVRHATKLTGLILALYPSQVFYSTQLIKDPFLVFFGILNLYSTIMMLKGKGKGFWIVWLLTFFGAFTFRPYAAIALVLSALIYLIFVWETKLSKKVFVVMLALAISAVAPLALGKGIFALDYILAWTDAEKVSEFRDLGYSTGGSSLDLAIDYSNPLSFLLTYGLSFATAMFGPFPWQIKAPIHLTAFPEAILSSLTFAYLLSKKSKYAKKNENGSDKLLLIFSIVLVAMIAFFSDNIGSNNRLRLLPWDVFFIYASIFVAKTRERGYLIKPQPPRMNPRKYQTKNT
jgi:Dolichyl-phosphate-mannose-protein mannosyltransferase